MGSIKVKVETYAGENIVEDIKQSASLSVGASVGASVIRDVNGRVVEVLVGIPDSVSAAGLETARAAVDANHGVAKATATPVGISGDLNNLAGAVGSTVPSPLVFSGGGSLTLAPQGDSTWQVSSATEAAGGAGKALRLALPIGSSPSGLTEKENWGGLRVDPSLNGFGQIYGFRMKFDIKLVQNANNPPVGSATNELDTDSVFVQIPGFYNANNPFSQTYWNLELAAGTIFRSGSQTNWYYRVYSPSSESMGPWVDSGVAKTSYLSMMAESRQSGIYTWEVGSSGVTIVNMGFDTSTSYTENGIYGYARVQQRGVFSGYPAYEAPRVIWDNLDITILDAV